MSRRLWGSSLGAVLLVHGAVAAALAMAPSAPPQVAEAPPILLDLVPVAAPVPEPPPAPPQAAPPTTPAPPKPLPRPKPKVERRVPAAVPLPQPAPPAQQAPGEPTEPAPAAAQPAAPQPAPSQPSAHAAASAVADPRAGANWQGRLLAHLERHKRYPTAAQGRGLRGGVVLAFALDRAGRVASAAVHTSSGHDALDQAALDMLARAQPLPPPPPEVAGDPVRLVVPVRFRLN